MTYYEYLADRKRRKDSDEQVAADYFNDAAIYLDRFESEINNPQPTTYKDYSQRFEALDNNTERVQNYIESLKGTENYDTLKTAFATYSSEIKNARERLSQPEPADAHIRSYLNNEYNKEAAQEAYQRELEEKSKMPHYGLTTGDNIENPFVSSSTVGDKTEMLYGIDKRELSDEYIKRVISTNSLDMRTDKGRSEVAKKYHINENELNEKYAAIRASEKQQDRQEKYDNLTYDELVGLMKSPDSFGQRIYQELDDEYGSYLSGYSEYDKNRIFQSRAEKYGISADDVRKIYEESNTRNDHKYDSSALSNDDLSYVVQRITETGTADDLKELKKSLPAAKYYDSLRYQLDSAIEDKNEEKYYLKVINEHPDLESKMQVRRGEGDFTGLNGDKLIQDLVTNELGNEDEAKKFIKYRGRYFERQRNAEAQENVKNFTASSGVAATLASIGSIPINMIGSVFDLPKIIAARVEELFTGDGWYDPKSTANYTAQNIRNTTTEMIDEATKDSGAWNYWAKQLYSSGMSGGDMVLAAAANAIPVVGQAASNAMFFSSAGVGAANEVIENGGSLSQATAAMIATGGAELIFERISLDKLEALAVSGNVDSAKDYFKGLVKQAFVEGSEEFNTTLANTFTDALINGGNNSVARKTREYIAQGMSEKEAESAAIWDWTQDIINDAVGGALTGGVAGGVAGGYNYAKTSKEYSSHGKELMSYEDFDLNALIEQGKQSESMEIGKLAEKIEGAKEPSAKDVGKLQMLLQEESDISERHRAETLKGDLSNNDKKIIAKVQNGSVLSKSDVQAVKDSPKLAEAIERFTNADPEEIKSIDFDEKRSNKANFKVSDNGVLLVNDNEFKGGLEIASVDPRRGLIVYDLNNADGTVKRTTSDKIRFATPNEALLHERASSYNTDQARAFVENYHDGQDVDNYAREWNLYSNYGRLAINLDPEKMNVGGTLTNAQKIAAYEMGLNSRIAANQIKTIVNSNESIKPYTSRNQGTFTDNVPAVVNLTKAQAQLKSFLRDMSAVTVLNVVLFQSKADANGNYMGENGSFDPSTNTLRVDINAGLTRVGEKEAYQYSILNTVAHELTHIAKLGGKYEILREAIISALGTTENKFNDLVEKKFDQLRKNKKYKNLSDEKLMELADEEVICGSCETMLQGNTKFFENLYKKDKGLGKKFVEAIKNLVEKIKAFVADRKYANTEYGRALLKVADDLYDQIQQLWNEAVESGLEAANVQKAENKEADNKVGGGKKSEIEVINFSDRIGSETIGLKTTVLDNLYKVSSENKFNTTKPFVFSNYPDKAIAEYFKSIGGKAINSIIGEIELKANGAESTIKHGYGKTKLNAVLAIKDVIEKGDIINYSPNYKNDGVDRYIIAAKGSLFDVKGDCFVAVVIRSFPNDNSIKSKFYLHEVYIINKEINTPSQSGATKSSKSAGELISNNIIAQSDENIKREFSDNDTKFSIREETPPENTIKGYKVFRVKDGKLYPPMVANPGGEATPIGVWLNADVGERAPDSKTGRAQVKGKGGMSLSFRPGWHLGDIPRAAQFDRKNPETGVKELFPADFVWAECDCAADVDYQDEAMSYGYTENGKFRHSYAGLPRVPENGYYKYRTNPRPDTVPWIITGAIKVNRILSDSEVAQILKDNGVEPPQRQGGNKTIEELGLNNDHIRSQDRFAEADRDYLSAVERGDMETAQKMVDEAAERALAESKIRNESGKLRRLYHGTYSDKFTVFDKGLIGKARAGDVGFFGRGFYFAFTKGEAGYYGKNIIEAYVDIKKPFNFQKELDTYNGERSFDMAASNAVFIVNFSDKFPELANKHKVQVVPKDSDNVEEISLTDFARKFKEIYSNKKFSVDKVNGYSGEEWVVTADKKKVEYTDYSGEKRSFYNYDYQQRFISEEAANNRINQVYSYLEKTAFDYIWLPNSTEIIQETDFSNSLINRGYDGVLQSDEGDEVVAFEPNQIKSADSVTYDDNGKVIPLSERFNTEEKDIRYQDRFTDDEIRDSVHKHFGHTYSWNETGYITTDGQRLDFSGRHQGAPGSGHRYVDHRDVWDGYPEALQEEFDGSDAMYDFISRGNIRIMPEASAIHLAVMPTQAQKNRLRDFISRERGEVTLEITDKNGNSLVSVEYPKKTSPGKVITDIEAYFESGQKPSVSDLGQFRYQDRDYSVEPEEYGDLFDDLFTDDGDLSFGEEPDTRRAESIIDKMIEYDAESAAYFLSYSASEIAQNTLNGMKDIELSDSSYLKIAKKLYNNSTVRMSIDSQTIADQVKAFVMLYDDGMYDSFDAFLSGIVKWNEENVRSDKFISPENMLTNAYNLISYIAEEKAGYANKTGEMSEDYAKMERMSDKAKAEAKRLKEENQQLNRSLIGQEDLTDYYRRETYYNRNEIAKLQMLNRQLEKAKEKAEQQADRRIERTLKRYNDKLDKQKLKVGEQKAAALDRMRERYEKLLDAEKAKAKSRRQANHDKVVERYEKRIAELKKKANQQKREIREDRDLKLIAAKDKRQADLKALRDNRDKKEYVRKIKKVASELQEWARHPTDKHFVPQEFLRSGFYQAVNDITEALIISDNTQIANKLREIAAEVQALQGEEEFKYDIDPVIAAEMNALAASIGGRKINRDLTLRQAEDIYKSLKGIKDSIVNARKLIFENETRDRVQVGIEIINEQKQLSPAFINRHLNGVKSYFLTPERIHNIINGFNENSALNKVFQEIRLGVEKKNDFYMDANKMFDAYRNAHGKELDHSQHNVRTVKWTDNAGNERETIMTGMQAMQLVMTWNREVADTRLAHMRNGGVSILGAEELAKGNLRKALVNRKKVRGINESFITNVSQSLTEFERGYIDIAEQFFNVMAKDAINEVSLKLRHFETATSDYYIPIKVDDAEIIKEIEGVKYDSSVENMGILKSIVPYSNKSVLIHGLDNVINKHIENVGNYYGLAIPIRNMNKVLNVSNTVINKDGAVTSSESVKGTLEEKWGRFFKDDVSGQTIYEQLLIDLQNSRAPKGEKYQAPSKMVRKIRSNFVTATLSMNPSVVLKQAASYSVAGVYIDQSALIKGSADMLKYLKPGNYQALLDEIDSHTSQHYMRRAGLSSNEVAAVQESWIKTSKFGRKINNSKLMQKMPNGVNPANWIQEMDCLTTAALWCATKAQIEKDYKKAGKQIDTDEYWKNVKDLYNKVIEDTQPMYDAMHRPEILKSSSELIKSVFMFKTQPLQNSGIIYDALGKLAQNKKDKAARRQLRKALMSQGKSLLVFAGMSLFTSFALHRMGRYKDEDDEVTAESIWNAFIRDVIQNGAGVVLPFGGNEGMGAIINMIDTGKLDASSLVQDNVVETVTGFLTAGANLVNTIGKEFSKDESGNVNPNEEKIAKATESFFITWVSDIFGLPVKNAKNIIKGTTEQIKDIVDGGEYNKPDVADMEAKQVVHSYQRHFEKGETDIANNRIQEFYGLKLQNAKDKGKDDPEKEARNAVRDAFTSYYKKVYQKAFKENNTAELERIRKVLTSQSKYMVWGQKNTPLSEKLREWQKEAAEE